MLSHSNQLMYQGPPALRNDWVPSVLLSGSFLGSHHPSPNVKTLCNFEPQIWPEIITSRDAESACFKGSGTSCDGIIVWHFWAKFRPEKITSRDGCCLPNSSDFGRERDNELINGARRLNERMTLASGDLMAD